jgi:uncharacterized protein
MYGSHRLELISALGCWLACAWAAAASASQVVTIDGPRPSGHIVDTVGLLAADDEAPLERFAAGIEAASRGDLVVVVIHTTAGRSPGAFATDLFNHWQLGSADRDDDHSIVALADRKAEIVHGDGVDDPAGQSTDHGWGVDPGVQGWPAGRRPPQGGAHLCH